MEPSVFFQRLNQNGINPMDFQRWLNDILHRQGFFGEEKLKDCIEYFEQRKDIETRVEFVGKLTREQKNTSLEVSSEDKAIEKKDLFTRKDEPEFSPPPMMIVESEIDQTRALGDLLNGGAKIKKTDEPLRIVNKRTPSIPELLLDTCPLSEIVGKVASSDIFEEITKTDRYAIIETLGEGGMGVVQLAFDQLLGREVALKRIKRNEGSFPEAEKIMLWRLQTEASITATLEHPNIVPLYDMECREGGEILFTMRKIEGKTFKDILMARKVGKFEESRILPIFLKVCEAVAYAHNKGVVHRDLKPENIMVGSFGEVYVMDWGIAKRIGEEIDFSTLKLDGDNTTETLQTKGILGTPGYMSPEQRKNAAKVSSQTDIHALGAILRECFTLLSPSEEFQKILSFYHQKDAEKQPEKIEEKLDRMIPTEIQHIIHKATEKELAKRYQRLEEFIEDLEESQKSFRVQVKEDTIFGLVKKWFQHHRQIVSSIATFALVFSGCFFFFLWQQHYYQQQKLQQSFEAARVALEEFDKIDGAGKYANTKRIKYLLAAFNALNIAFLTNKAPIETAQKKWQVGRELITLTCNEKQFDLSRYIAKELQLLSIIKAKEKKSLFSLITQEEKKTLRQHLSRLEYWFHKLKTKDTLIDLRSDALFDFSSMGEEEVLKKIIPYLEEGTEYFLANQKRVAIQDKFYETVALSLGWLGHPKAKKPLLASLQKMAKKVVSNSGESIEETLYMIALAKSLSRIKAKNVIDVFARIREEMGKESFFWEHTKAEYEALSKIESNFKK